MIAARLALAGPFLGLAMWSGAAHAVGGAAADGGPAAVASVWLDGDFACSGVLYAPDRVVTAAHCVEHLPGDSASEVRLAGESISVAHITLHPDHFAAAEADIAVLWLSSSAPVTPISLRADPPEGDWDLWDLRVAGWGGSEPGDAGMGDSLRSFTALAEDLTTSALLFDGGAAWVCNGDSGGAVLLEVGGQPELVGVVVGGPSECGGPGEALRVDVFARFLQDPEGTGVGDRPFGEDDDGADTAPDDGSAAGDFETGSAPTSLSPAGCAVGAGATPARTALLAVLGLVTLRRRRAGRPA